MNTPSLFPTPPLPIRERFPAGTAVGDAIRRYDRIVAAEKELKSKRPSADKEAAADAAKEE